MTEAKSNVGQSGISEGWDRYSLLESLIKRRSRRFAKAMELDGGPLTHSSQQQAQPLTIEEEAALAFAACGITGPVLAELPFQSGKTPESGSGNIMTYLVGRTVASGDAVHSRIMFLINDDGTWMLKRPQDFPRRQIAELARSAREHEFVELHQKSRVRLAEIGGLFDLNRRRLQVRKQPESFAAWDRELRGALWGLARQRDAELGSPTLPKACKKVLRSLEVSVSSPSPAINTSTPVSRSASPSGLTEDPLPRNPKRPNPNTSIRSPVCCEMPPASSAPSPRQTGSWPLGSTARACPGNGSSRHCFWVAPASTSPGSTVTPEARSPP